MSKIFSVTFLPLNTIIMAEKGMTIYDCALEAGIDLNAACGGGGVCGKCLVTIFPEGYQVKACNYKIFGDITVKLNKSASSFIPAIINSTSLKHFSWQSNSIFKKINIELSKPTLDDPRDDVARLRDAIFLLTGIDNIDIPLSILRRISRRLRENNWNIYVIYAQLQGKIIVTHISDDTEIRLIAVDLGTTTIQASIIDGESGAYLASASVLNPQSLYGADVINRIIASEKHLSELSESVNNIINKLMECMQEYIGDKKPVQCVLVSANTVMLHFLYGFTPEFIRKEPYVPVSKSFPILEGSQLGIDAPIVLTSPCIASYVGADIVSGVIYTGLYKSDKPCLFIDLGTNGEIVLGCKDYIVCCSASAGPAFEGGGLKCGKRASGGAISSVEINDGEILVKTIDGSKPDGICASGFISILANLLRNKIIDKRGRFNDDSPFTVSDGEYKKLIIHEDNNIFIDESDIENFMRAKSAIFAASEFLLNSMGVSNKELSKVYIAGGISESLNIEDSFEIGLLPYIENGEYILSGNTSLYGSIIMLGDRALYDKAFEISQQAMYFDLASAPEFNELWSAGMFLPHTDESKFIVK